MVALRAVAPGTPLREGLDRILQAHMIQSEIASGAASSATSSHERPAQRVASATSTTTSRLHAV